MATERAAVSAPTGPMTDTYEKFLKVHREFTVLRTHDTTSHCVIAFCDSSSETYRSVSQALATVQKEYPHFEYDVVAVEKDSKLNELCKKGKRKAPMALVIEAGVVKTVVDLTTCKSLAECCKRCIKGESATSVFGPQYGEDYRLKLADIFGGGKQDYHIETMREFVEMYMRVMHDAHEHPCDATCVLFYDDDCESQYKVKSKFDSLRSSMPEAEFVAVKVDKDSKLRELATSQGRSLPAALAIREGKVCHVSSCSELKKYVAEVKKFVSGECAEKAFTGYNGERFRMKLCDQYICSTGLGEINEMPMMVDFVHRVKADGHEHRHQRVMALLYTPECAKDAAVSAFRSELPALHHNVDFCLIYGDAKIDPRMSEMIAQKTSACPAALCIEGGRVEACVPVTYDEDFKHKVAKFANGHSASVAFAEKMSKPFKAPVALKAKQPTHIQYARCMTDFVKVLRRMQRETETDADACAALLVCDAKTPLAKEIENKMHDSASLPSEMAFGVADVSSDDCLKKFVSKEQELPCLFVIEEGKIVGTAYMTCIEDFVDVVYRCRGPSGSAARALPPKKTKAGRNTTRFLRAEAKGRDAIPEITTYGEFLDRLGDMVRSRSDEQGRGIMVCYRDADKGVEDFATHLHVIEQAFPKLEYAAVNVSEDEMLESVARSEAGPLPAVITFDYGRAFCAHIKSPRDLLEKARQLMDGEQVGEEMALTKAFGGDMSLPSASPNTQILCASRKPRIEEKKGAEDFKDLMFDMTINYKKAPSKALIVVYCKHHPESAYLKKLMMTVVEDHPSLRVAMCEADEDDYMTALAKDIGYQMPYVVVFEKGMPAARYEICEVRELSDCIKKFYEGECAMEAFQSSRKGAESACRIVQALYHLDAEMQEKKRCELLTCQARNVLFMKGSRRDPQCKFSKAAIKILEDAKVDFVTEDILLNPRAREELKKYSQWQTFPQLYHCGEFIGGVDIMRALAETDELIETLE